MKESEVGGTLADFLTFLWRHRLLIVGVAGISTLVTIIYVMVVPVEYKAKASLLPQESSSPGLFSAAMSLMGGNLSGIDLPFQSSEGAIQESVLRSRRLADLMNEDFDLDGRYKSEHRESRLRRWFNKLGVESNTQGLLTVSFQDKDPEFATKVVTRLLEHLDHFNRELRSTTGRRVRVFLEQRLVETEKQLRQVEDSLAAFQTENRTLALSPGVDEVVQAGAEILVRRIQLEIEVKMMRETLGATAPALRAKEMEVKALDRQLARLPALNTKMSRFLRSLGVHQRTYTFLSVQLEESRLEEARDTPTIQILDPPTIPEEKSWPQRTYTVLAVFLGSTIFSLVLSVVLDAAREARRKEAGASV